MERGLKAALSAKEVAGLVQIGLLREGQREVSDAIRKRLIQLDLVEVKEIGTVLTETGRRRLALEERA
jgi:hypothetical protein